MGWARSSTTSFGPNSSRRRSASAEDKPTGTGAPVIAGCATETSISRGDAEESFSPRQEKAKIARDATTKFGYSRGETEAARLQVALPAQLDLGGLSAQRAGPIRLERVDRAASIAAQLGQLSTPAPLRDLRARASDPAWARRAVGEGVRSCPRAGCREIRMSGSRKTEQNELVLPHLCGRLACILQHDPPALVGDLVIDEFPHFLLALLCCDATRLFAVPRLPALKILDLPTEVIDPKTRAIRRWSR